MLRLKEKRSQILFNLMENNPTRWTLSNTAWTKVKERNKTTSNALKFRKKISQFSRKKNKNENRSFL